MLIPDDPLIRCAEETGYAPWIDPAKEPRCPVCGEVCKNVYKDSYGEIVGCDECLTEHDAWEDDECCPWRDE